ncbi:MAG: hypothetical protein JXA74_13525, partial [Anaerolineae bacterium]|nr:hypothetical protein [Anaerolineae bacterium]
MLSPAHVLAALEAKREAFGRFERGQTEQRALYRQALEWYAGQSREALETALRPYARPGARPTSERRAGVSVVRSFSEEWENHQQARAWARGIIEGVTT